MMLASIFHMLANNGDFHPDGYEAAVHPMKQKPVALNPEHTIQFLRGQGVNLETIKLIQKPYAAQAG